MKITAVEPMVLRFWDIPEKDGYTDDLFVRVDTDEGIEGIGEIDGPPLVQLGLIRSIHPGTWWRGLEERLLGENPLKIDRLWQKMHKHAIFYGGSGLIVSAVSGVDMALWDVAGKFHNKPVYSLLGGKEGVVTPYSSVAPFGSTEEEVTERCRVMVKEPGYIAAKFHDHPMGVDDEMALRLVRRAREELGQDVTMMLDAANNFETDAAIAFAQAIKPFHIYFLEAPLRTDNLAGYARLKASTSVKIAAGEELTTDFQFANLIERGKVDVIQPDTIWTGGITGCRTIVEHANEQGVLVVMHCDKSNVNFAANLHLSAASPNCPFTESPVSTPALYKQITNEKFEPGSDGRIQLPETPGLGVSLNSKIVNECRIDVSDIGYARR
jgi:L-rhamnonate dehydratase